MNFSALIPRKPDNGFRDYIWSHIKKRYQLLLPQLEVCVGIDESEPLFNKAKAVNRAAKKAHGDIFIVVDADVIFNPELIDKIASVIHLHPWIVPYKDGYLLTKEATDRLIEEGLPAAIKISDGDIENKYNGKGALMNVMTRACFKAVYGFDKRFKGWGYEDTAFYLSLDAICGKHFIMNEAIYHLWHPRAEIYHKHWKESKKLYDRYKEAVKDPKKMKKIIEERFKK